MIQNNNIQYANPKLGTIRQENEIQISSSAILIDILKSQDRLSQKNKRRTQRKKRIFTPKYQQGVELPNRSYHQEEKRQQKQSNHQQCPVCFAEFQRVLLRQFSTCQHNFCKTCLLQHIKNSIKNFQPVRCLTEDCPIILEIQSPHIRSLSINQRQRYYKALVFFNLSKNSQLKLCPNDNCEGFVNITQEIVRCAICEVVFCRKCMMLAHKGQCDQNGVLFLQDNFKFRQCERCKMMVQKNKGCNHMTCLCKYQFCYICGGKWGANHVCHQPAANKTLNLPPPQPLPQQGLVNPSPPQPSAAVRQQGHLPQQQIPNVSAQSSTAVNNTRREQNIQHRSDEFNMKRRLKILLAIFLVLLITIIDISWGLSFVSILSILKLLRFIYLIAKNGFNNFKENYSCVQILIGNIFLILFCIGRQIARQFGDQLSRSCVELNENKDILIFPLSKIVLRKLTQ